MSPTVEYPELQWFNTLTHAFLEDPFEGFRRALADDAVAAEQIADVRELELFLA